MLTVNGSEYVQLLESEYRETVKLMCEGKLHTTKAHIKLSHLLDLFLEDIREQNPNAPYFDISALTKAFLLEKKYETFEQNRVIGCFVAALILLGSSLNQACLATGQLLGHKRGSPQTSKKAYQIFKSINDLKRDRDPDHFIEINVYSLKQALGMAKKPFPTELGVMEAKKAYDRLVNKVNKYQAKDEAKPKIVR